MRGPAKVTMTYHPKQRAAALSFPDGRVLIVRGVTRYIAGTLLEAARRRASEAQPPADFERPGVARA
jgi:hypothetical protein